MTPVPAPAASSGKGAGTRGGSGPAPNGVPIVEGGGDGGGPVGSVGSGAAVVAGGAGGVSSLAPPHVLMGPASAALGTRIAHEIAIATSPERAIVPPLNVPELHLRVRLVLGDRRLQMRHGERRL